MTEGVGVEVRLSGEALGFYAYPIAIGVTCAETIAADVEPGILTPFQALTLVCS